MDLKRIKIIWWKLKAVLWMFLGTPSKTAWYLLEKLMQNSFIDNIQKYAKVEDPLRELLLDYAT